MLKFKIGR